MEEDKNSLIESRESKQLSTIKDISFESEYSCTREAESPARPTEK